MTDLQQVETELADLIQGAIQFASNNTARSAQQQDHRLGMSDLGHCHEYARRMILQEPFTDPRDKTQAFIGTVLGDAVETAVGRVAEGWVFQQEVVTTLPSGTQILGHPDMLSRNILVDLKSKDGTQVVRKMGQTQQQRFQLHGYGAGAVDAGLCDEDGLIVANVFYDRSGKEPRPYVVAEPYDPQVVEQIDLWLEDVFYAVRNGEEARRDPPRDWCERFCEFYTGCRVYDTDVSGLVQSPDILAAVEAYLEGQAMVREGKKKQDDAKHVLDGVTGSTGAHMIRWTDIGATDVPGFTRAGYKKIDVRAIPKGKK